MWTTETVDIVLQYYTTTYVLSVCAINSVHLTVQELAEQSGDTERVGELKRKLEELEERAEELDKQRSKGLSAIRYACISLFWVNDAIKLG